MSLAARLSNDCHGLDFVTGYCLNIFSTDFLTLFSAFRASSDIASMMLLLFLLLLSSMVLAVPRQSSCLSEASVRKTTSVPTSTSQVWLLTLMPLLIWPAQSPVVDQRLLATSMSMSTATMYRRRRSLSPSTRRRPRAANCPSMFDLICWSMSGFFAGTPSAHE